MPNDSISKRINVIQKQIIYFILMNSSLVAETEQRQSFCTPFGLATVNNYLPVKQTLMSHIFEQLHRVVASFMAISSVTSSAFGHCEF